MDKIEKEKMARRRRIAEEIAQAMLEAGLSRKEFAMKMHRQPSEVTRWLSGNHNFTSDLLAEMSVVLSRPISGAEDVIVKGYGVDGYDGRSESTLLRDEGSVICGINLPQSVTDALVARAKDMGMTLREYVRNILTEKAAEKRITAYDFCGIWDEGYPGSDEIAGFRTKNTFPAL